ncbi:MAG: glycosyltransferase family 4 protein, partial [bacterium]|nr:glycosyltransferase family 4 protein [bacterium]
NELGIAKAFCVPNGSDPGLFAPDNRAATALSDLDGKFKVLWMGNSESSWQGVEVIIETARQMEHSDPDVVFVLFTGVSSRRFPVLRNLFVMRQIPYHDCPYFLVAADACLCLYHSCDWMRPGFYFSPLKLFDYMAAGKPVIASAAGQISDVIQDGKNGLLVHDNNIDTIIARLRELKADAALRQRLGSAARKAVIDFYNWERVAEQTETVLLDVCGK